MGLWDKYEASGQRLGEGEYSDVSVVRRKSDGKCFACKTTRFAAAVEGSSSAAAEAVEQRRQKQPQRKQQRKQEQLARARMEAECLGKLQARGGCGGGVVALEEMVAEEGAVHLLLELCHGGSLGDRIRQSGPLREAEAAAAVGALAATLAHVHAAGILHRDIKPDNILLGAGAGQQLRLKLADFGSSSRLLCRGRGCCGFSESESRARVGTPRYVAPEVVRGRGYGGAADVWSLGATLYHMLAGRAAFSHVRTAALLSQLEASLLDPDAALDWSALPPGGAADLVRSMMHTNPYKRPKPTDIARHPWVLRHSAVPVPVLAVPESVPEAVPEPAAAAPEAAAAVPEAAPAAATAAAAEADATAANINSNTSAAAAATTTNNNNTACSTTTNNQKASKQQLVVWCH